MFFSFVIVLLAVISVSSVDCLTCLHCTDIQSPRHCKYVIACQQGEVCNVHRTTNPSGDVVFDVGCVHPSACSNRSQSHQACDMCCSTDLCNAAGCGLTGYPSTRGPVCYNCPAQVTDGTCHKIDVCGINEVCMINEQSEFGDTVYTSQCVGLTHCERHTMDISQIIGRSISDDTRSLAETVCHKCCHEDLCNANCGSKHPDICASNPCVFGTCVNNSTGYACVCESSYTGHNCSDVNYCAPNPCEHGTCVNGRTNYTCVCDSTHTGRMCTEVDYCAPNPCEHGTCVNGRTNYTCVCDPNHTGRKCTEVNYCAQNPCKHGTCVNGRTNYTCVCDLSHIGRNCTEVNYCAQNPCEHGTCVNGRTNYTCVCDLSHTGRNCTEFNRQDCLELRNRTSVSGVYRVQPAGSNQAIQVYCDMSTDGGGWTVFQRRVNGSVDFFQNFSSYENGFGDVHGEHWLGLKYIYAMTSNSPTELRIDLMAADGSTAYEVFPNFRLSAATDYTLHVDRGHGTAGDDAYGLSWHNGYRFSSYDHDDVNSCAQRRSGGWWYNFCAAVDLNGKYVSPGTVDSPDQEGIVYMDFKKQRETLKESKMMFRRV